MNKDYTIEADCCAYYGNFKCVKVFNYKGLNRIVNTVSLSLDVYGSTENLVGFWKIKKLKQ